jgi:uncharacterized protein (DUF1501 family)
MQRRTFLSQTALTAVGTWLLPTFLTQGQPLSVNGKKLVVLQLSGGNDGLNTLVPFRNDVYYRLRPQLAIPASQLIRLNDEMGMNPALAGLQSIFSDGGLGLINQVGYPNPDRSHFRSMDIWQSASGSREYLNTGWIGRFLDARCRGNALPHEAIEVDDTLSLALKGAEVQGLAMAQPQRLLRQVQQPLVEAIAAGPAMLNEDNLGYLYKTLASTVSSANYIQEKTRLKASQANYPNSALGKHFKTVSSMLLSGLETQVYYLSHTGFDTHAQQANRHTRVLQEMGDALAAFYGDLKSNGLHKDVLVLVFSEFGRRVAENGSRGTDHGTAGPMFLIGEGMGRLQSHLVPRLDDLDGGDLRYQTDFRDVYAGILQQHLGCDYKTILGEGRKPLSW